MTISVTSRWWPAVTAVLVLPLLVLLLLLVPDDQRELGDGGIVLFALATGVALGTVVAAAYVSRGSASFAADQHGLHLRGRGPGTEHLVWAELLEVGWVVPTRYTRGGLAGRRRTGGPYEPGGPAIAGWLSQPTGPVRAPQGLQELCEQHGVPWRDYAPAEVM